MNILVSFPSYGLHGNKLLFYILRYTIPGPESVSTAAGVIVANGQAQCGEQTGTKVKDFTPYITTDGGRNWKAMFSGPPSDHGAMHIAILDHASVIALVFAGQYNDTLFYTVNYGASIQKYPLVETGSRKVLGMVTEPGSASTTLFIYWMPAIWHGTRWVGKRFDFDDLFFHGVYNGTTPSGNASRVRIGDCSGVPGESDYIDWSPAGCPLGAKYTYRRKNPCAVCRNGLRLESEPNVTRCNCTGSDFMCAFGFYRYEEDDGETLASAECQIDLSYEKQLCANGNSSETLMYYQRVPGDTCITDKTSNQTYQQPRSTPCPKKPKDSTPTIVAVLVVLGLIVVSVGAYFGFRRNGCIRKVTLFVVVVSWRRQHNCFFSLLLLLVDISLTYRCGRNGRLP